MSGRFRVVFSGLALGLAACAGVGPVGEEEGDGDDMVDPPKDPEEVIDEAKEELPTYLDLHTKVIARTCSPDDGVCHHAKEYPDLTTPQAMLGAVGGRCNLATEDPLEVFNGCEQLGDELRFPEYGPNKDWASEIAYAVHEPTNLPGQSGTDVVLALRDDVPNPMNDPNQLETIFIWRHYPDESIELAPFYGTVSYEAGENIVTIHLIEEQSEARQELLNGGLRLGDPNQDGIFGYDETEFRVVDPGHPETSYLLGRLLGVVPGTPMPLANEPLSSAEVLAMTCWIESIDDDAGAGVYDAIDYDDCQAAADFGKGDPESGHAFKADVLPILSRCTGGGCHSGENPAQGLNLTEDVAHENLLRASEQDPLTLLVTPGNPTNSYLMMKLRGTGVAGLQMPREAGGAGEPLPEEDLAVIEQWIVAGAPND